MHNQEDLGECYNNQLFILDLNCYQWLLVPTTGAPGMKNYCLILLWQSLITAQRNWDCENGSIDLVVIFIGPGKH